MNKFISWYRNKRYYVGGVIFVALAFLMSLCDECIDPVRRIMIVGFMGPQDVCEKLHVMDKLPSAFRWRDAKLTSEQTVKIAEVVETTRPADG